MLRPPNMAVLLLSVHPLLDQCLLHLYPAYMTDLDLPTYLPLPQLVTVPHCPPITGNLHAPPPRPQEQKLPPCPACHGVSLQDLASDM